MILREFLIKDYVPNCEHLGKGTFLGEDYFESLLAEIREVRLSERKYDNRIFIKVTRFTP